MRAAAAALVLIIVAVVILVFANTLNSWVLGGLIGGLAALLLSIPVSLFLFTILARRHDQELQALQQELEEMAFAGQAENEYAGVYEADVYVLADEEEYYNEPGSRRLPDVRALPPAGQSQASTAGTSGFNVRTGNYSQAYRRPSQALPQGRGKGSPTQHLAVDRRQPRRSSYEVNAMRSRFQTEALRAARREAALQFDDVEDVSTRSPAPNKRVPPGRSSQPLTDQSTRFRQAPSTRELSPRQQQVANQNGARRVFDAASSSGEANASKRSTRTDSLRMREPRTDQLRDRNQHPQTEPFRVRPQTGKIVRNPQLGEQLRDPETITGSLKNPLVRRAPYLYEDDALREELAQQIDGGPIMRRSSRFLQYEEEK
jgi:hypothetical protein